MKISHIILGTILIFTQLIHAQQTDKNHDCIINLARSFFFKMAIVDSIQSQKISLIFTEVLNGEGIETQQNGIFIISNLNAHRRKLILLKKENQFKLLTFSNVKKSLQELILFLDDINTDEKDLFRYINFIEKYLELSKEKIKVNKTFDSDWIICS